MLDGLRSWCGVWLLLIGLAVLSRHRLQDERIGRRSRWRILARAREFPRRIGSMNGSFAWKAAVLSP